jgi:hypothetical protein
LQKKRTGDGSGRIKIGKQRQLRIIDLKRRGCQQDRGPPPRGRRKRHLVFFLGRLYRTSKGCSNVDEIEDARSREFNIFQQAQRIRLKQKASKTAEFVKWLVTALGAGGRAFKPPAPTNRICRLAPEATKEPEAKAARPT